MPSSCEFCGSEQAERIQLKTPSLTVGLPMPEASVHACERCTATGFERAFEIMRAHVADLPRRRAILSLNRELKAMIDSGASQDEIDQNRAEKSALVDLSRQSTPQQKAAMARALSRLQGS